MKTKMIYGIAFFLGILFIGFLLSNKKSEEVSLIDMSSEIVLLSDTISSENDLNEIEETPLTTSIKAQKEMLEMNLDILISLKDSFENDYSMMSQRDKIFIKISLIELSKYRDMYRETFGSIYQLLAPYQGNIDTLNQEDIEILETKIFDIQTYRFVLLEKTNQEILTLIDILNKY